MRIIGVDPGNIQSGVSMIEEKTIMYARNLPNEAVFGKLQELAAGMKIVAAIEDIVPYGLKLSPPVIDTCKFIGQLCWRLTGADFVESINLVARSSVRKWIFDSAPATVLPRIEKRMLAMDKRKAAAGLRGLRNGDGSMRLPSFHYVDDRAVIAALKFLYGIPTPKPGKENIYGLRDHSWQALGAAAYYASQNNRM